MTLAVAIVLLSGTVTFVYVEELTAVDAAYLTTVTVTTIGFGDIVPTTDNGKGAVGVFVLIGVGLVGYALSTISQISGNRVKDLVAKLHSKGLSDPYVVLGPADRASSSSCASRCRCFVYFPCCAPGGAWFYTPVAKRTLNPSWPHPPVWSLPGEYSASGTLFFEVYDWDANTVDDLIGSVLVPIPPHILHASPPDAERPHDAQSPYSDAYTGIGPSSAFSSAQDVPIEPLSQTPPDAWYPINVPLTLSDDAADMYLRAPPPSASTTSSSVSSASSALDSDTTALVPNPRLKIAIRRHGDAIEVKVLSASGLPVMDMSMIGNALRRALNKDLLEVILAFAVLGVLVVGGTLAFAHIEDWRLLDAFYWAVITLFTIVIIIIIL